MMMKDISILFITPQDLSTTSYVWMRVVLKLYQMRFKFLYLEAVGGGAQLNIVFINVVCALCRYIYRLCVTPCEHNALMATSEVLKMIYILIFNKLLGSYNYLINDYLNWVFFLRARLWQ